MKTSAGILVYRRTHSKLEVFLVHPGGPFWKNKDKGAWSIPKGEFQDGEDPLDAAQREFKEEIGMEVTGNFISLTPVRLKSGKLVHAWAVEKDLDHTRINSNYFPLEWPPRSGKMVDVPEVDKAGWFGLSAAREKLNPGQWPLLDELAGKIGIKRKPFD